MIYMCQKTNEFKATSFDVENEEQMRTFREKFKITSKSPEEILKKLKEFAIENSDYGIAIMVVDIVTFVKEFSFLEKVLKINNGTKVELTN